MAQPTDRELLEMAAQAAGYSIRFASDGTCFRMDKEWAGEWAPLADGGDAFRLMVKTKLHIGLESDTVSAWASDDFGNFQTEVLRHRGDEAATRRAIVRAAAAKVKGGAL